MTSEIDLQSTSLEIGYFWALSKLSPPPYHQKETKGLSERCVDFSRISATSELKSFLVLPLRIYRYYLRKALLEDVLVNPAHALIRQVHDHYLPGLVHVSPNDVPKDIKAVKKNIAEQNILFNIDGFGVAFYTNVSSEFREDIIGPRPALYKSIAPALTDPTFLSLCANISSHTILAHVRATSLSPVVATNCHPFTFGRHTFAHNGLIEYFDKVRRELSLLIKEEYFAAMRGTTDSEHIAALYMTYLDAGRGEGGSGGAGEKSFTVEEMKNALGKAIGDVQEAQKKVLTQRELAKAANSLNIVATDGQRLVAVRWRNHPTEQPPSLYVSTSAAITLNRKYPNHPDSGDPTKAVKGGSKEHLEQRKQKLEKEEHGLHVIIASEPTTFRPHEWTLLDKNHVVMVDDTMHLIVEELRL